MRGRLPQRGTSTSPCRTICWVGCPQMGRLPACLHARRGCRLWREASELLLLLQQAAGSSAAMLAATQPASCSPCTVPPPACCHAGAAEAPADAGLGEGQEGGDPSQLLHSVGTFAQVGGWVGMVGVGGWVGG